MLEDWIFVAQKTEMDAIEEMCIVIKDSIENETKIQSELRIKFMDFTVDYGALNYITPPPPKHAPYEVIKPQRFTISQIDSTVTELDRLAVNGDNKVRVTALFQFFKSRRNASLTFQGFDTTLPSYWESMSQDYFMALIRNLDPQSSGLIDWRRMMTYFILIQSKIPSQQEADKLSQLADSDGCVSKETFVSSAFWFDKNEATEDLDYHIPFERNRFIKEQLFRVNAVTVQGKEGHQVRANVLAENLRLPAGKKDC